MLKFRSLLFDLYFYIVTPVFLGAFLPLVWIFKRPVAKFAYKTWTKISLFGLKYIVGISYKIEGKKYLDEINKRKACIVASNHQSVFDTFIFSVLIDEFQVVFKREILNLPILSSYFKTLNSIPVNRSKGFQAIKDLLKKSQCAIDNKRAVFIFPEGTRSIYGDPIKIKSGVVFLYMNLSVPVFPVILNSGKFWGRRKLFKKSGEITIKFLPPIESGLKKEEFAKKLEESFSIGLEPF